MVLTPVLSDVVAELTWAHVCPTYQDDHVITLSLSFPFSFLSSPLPLFSSGEVGQWVDRRLAGWVEHPGLELNRINRILVPISCNFFSGSRSRKKSEVKHSWPGAISSRVHISEEKVCRKDLSRYKPACISDFLVEGRFYNLMTSWGTSYVPFPLMILAMFRFHPKIFHPVTSNVWTPAWSIKYLNTCMKY